MNKKFTRDDIDTFLYGKENEEGYLQSIFRYDFQKQETPVELATVLCVFLKQNNLMEEDQ